MDQAKKQIEGLISKIKASFPDENDLKGFAGISTTGIIHMLGKSMAALELLVPYNDDVETIFLKRELADVIEKTYKELNVKFEKIRPQEFNNILRKVAKIQYLIKETYFSLVSEPSFRTEAQIEAANRELTYLSGTVGKIKEFHEEVSTNENEIRSIIQHVKTLGNEYETEIGKMRENAKISKAKVDEISTDLELKQKKAVESEQKTDAYFLKIETDKQNIESINKNVMAWEQEINNSQEDFTKSAIAYDLLVKKAAETKLEIEVTYSKIAGKKSEEGKIIDNGYLQEAEWIKKQLELLLNDQVVKYKALFEQIESLLPGATSAGLAEAFEKQKQSYNRPIRVWSWVFIAVTSLMTLCSMYLFYVQFIKGTNNNETWEHGLLSLLRDLPFFIPTIWLAVFASRQQSQFKRMQEEYAFKEINAKAFYGHKKQIEELAKQNAVDIELLSKLVVNLVSITSQNPSYTLDSKSHNDSPPLFKFIRDLNPWVNKGENREKPKVENSMEHASNNNGTGTN